MRYLYVFLFSMLLGTTTFAQTELCFISSPNVNEPDKIGVLNQCDETRNVILLMQYANGETSETTICLSPGQEVIRPMPVESSVSMIPGDSC